MKTTENMWEKWADAQFPAWVRLEKGASKLMYSLNDAISWAISCKYSIVSIEEFKFEVPEDYNSSAASVFLSNRLTGGSDDDFVDDFVDYECLYLRPRPKQVESLITLKK
jgi:hypothetical protein